MKCDILLAQILIDDYEETEYLYCKIRKRRSTIQ